MSSVMKGQLRGELWLETNLTEVQLIMTRRGRNHPVSRQVLWSNISTLIPGEESVTSRKCFRLD